MPRSCWLAVAFALTACSTPTTKPAIKESQLSHAVSGSIIASNTARLGGTVAGLIAKTKYRLADATALAPLAGAQVEVLDEAGQTVSYGPVTTDAAGAFVFRKLKPSGPVVYLHVTMGSGDAAVSLKAVALAPRATNQDGVAVDPATTLVAKKTLTLVASRALGAAGVDARTAAKVAAAVLPQLDDATAMAAEAHDDGTAAHDFDVLLAGHAELVKAITTLVGSTPLSHLLDPSVDAGAGAGGTHLGRIDTPPAPNVTGEADGTTRVAGGPKAGYAEGEQAAFDTPYDVATGPDGTLYVADSNNNAIRKIDLAGDVPVTSTLAGGGDPGFADGTGSKAQFNAPSGCTVGPDGALYVADYGNHRIRRVSLSGSDAGAVTTIAGTGSPAFADGPGAVAKLSSPADLTMDLAGHLIVADTDNHRIRMIDLHDASHPVTTVAGSGTQGLADGDGAAAHFNGPQDVAVDAHGDVFVADTGNHAIRRIDMGQAGHPVSTLAGNGTAGYQDGTGTAASFNTPYGIAFGPGGLLYVADANNNSLRTVTPAGVVATYWGEVTPDPTKPSGLFNQPSGLAVRRNARGVVEVFVADAGNNAIRKLALPAAQSALTDDFNAK